MQEVRVPRDAGIDNWRECRLHRSDKVLLELAVESFQACEKGDAGTYSPNVYSQRRNGNEYCYGGSALAQTELLVCLVGARLHKVRKG